MSLMKQGRMSVEYLASRIMLVRHRNLGQYNYQHCHLLFKDGEVLDYNVTSSNLKYCHNRYCRYVPHRLLAHNVSNYLHSLAYHYQPPACFLRALHKIY